MTHSQPFNQEALAAACRAVVRNTLWQRPKPESIEEIIDTDQISELTNAYYEIAVQHVEFVQDQGRDPNLITRAVLYLVWVHAIPPMREDLRWFSNMLDALLELACPNTIHTSESIGFLEDVEAGIAVSRREFQTT